MFFFVVFFFFKEKKVFSSSFMWSLVNENIGKYIVSKKIIILEDICN